MSLSLKAELETWAAALKAYDEQDFERALELFSGISESSKILTNMGLIYATIGEHETAVEHFTAATNLDSYLAIAHFQCGVSNFLLERYDLALLNFEDAFLYLRGNGAINYEQIGLRFKLFSAEIMFNKGLAEINLGYAEGGIADLREASKQKVTDEHGVIDDAIRDNGMGYTVFSIPVGVLYRPSENKLKNSKSKDYLGKAKLVAASDSNDAFTEFTGAKKLQQASADKEDEHKSDAEPLGLNRSATAPAPRPDLTAIRAAALERSKTTPQRGAQVPVPPMDFVAMRAGILQRVKSSSQLSADANSNAATILTPQRAQSASIPANEPPRPLTPGLSRSNTGLHRNNTMQLARNGLINAGTVPLKIKAPRGATNGIVGGGVGGSGAESASALSRTPTQPKLRRPPRPEASQVTQQSVAQSSPQSLRPGQSFNASRGVTPLALSAPPAPVQRDHLSQFYDAYMDAYMDESASRLAFPVPPAIQTQPPLPSQPQAQQRPFTRVQSPASLAWRSSNMSSGSWASRGSSRSGNAGAANTNSIVATGGVYTGKGGISNAGWGAPRRRPARRTTTRRVTVYDDEEGDDGFVTSDHDEFEMANIRVKLHYQGDVRGMAIPPTTPFKEFVQRVTAKFGTSPTGLEMKFMDEDGTKISLRDEGDFELAIETARESARGRSEGKIEVWCVDRE